MPPSSGPAVRSAWSRRRRRAAEDEPPVLTPRRGWSVRRRLGAPDSYGVLLILIVLSLFASLLGGRSAVGSAVAVAVAAGMVLFALRTSRTAPRLRGIAALLVTVLVAATIGASAVAGVGAAASDLATAVLVLGAATAVSRRLVAHPDVGGPTILGAVCVYLLIGLFFAAVYVVIGANGRAFAQPGAPTTIETMYFSFITLATVGYGDITPGTDLVRVLAMTEALTGQLYLVTVIAVLVGNIGARRLRRSGGTDGSDGGCAPPARDGLASRDG